MKRYGNLYEKIVDIDNCRMAILDASRKKKKRNAVLRVLKDVDGFALELQRRLQTGEITSPYRRKVITDGLSGKKRVLQIPAFFPDQCVHHAIMRVVRPIIKKRCYHWSCANVPGRGISRAAMGVERWTKRRKKRAKYCLKLDIHHFYPSINHDILKAKLRRVFKDEKMLWLLDIIINSYGPGLPIGNYTSPWLAELYLEDLDRTIKLSGQRVYIRYADDLVLISPNKRKLRRTHKELLKSTDRLSLLINHGWQLYRIRMEHCKRGRKIDFLGRCFARGYTTVRKRRALAFMRQSRRIRKMQEAKIIVPLKEAESFISRSSIFWHKVPGSGRKKARRKPYMSTKHLKETYYDVINIKELKDTIREASRIRSKGGTP